MSCSAFGASWNHSIEPTTRAWEVFALSVTESKVGSPGVSAEPGFSARNAADGFAVFRPIVSSFASIGTIVAPARPTADA